MAKNFNAWELQQKINEVDNKAEKMATRLAKFENPKQDFIGSY